MTKKLFATTTLAFAMASVAIAQDSTKTLVFSGGADAYYRYNFADKRSGSNNYNNYTSFTNSQNSFELGIASIRADASAMSGKVTATVDVGFGRRAEEFSYNDGRAGYISLSNIKQLYVTYAPSAKIRFTAGKFATHVGYELVDAQLNRNYSMSYMFTNGPFFHTGLKADITAGPVGIMLGVTNFTDQSTSTTNVKSLIAQVSGGSKNGKLKAYLNYVGSYGSNELAIPGSLKSLSQFDLVVNGTVTSKFGIGFNATVQSRKTDTTSGSWWGAALYLNYDPTAKIGLTLRSEYIGDSKMYYFGTKSIFANTLSLNYKVGPLTIIPEVRFETSDTKIYLDKKAADTKSTFSLLCAVVYKF